MAISKKYPFKEYRTTNPCDYHGYVTDPNCTRCDQKVETRVMYYTKEEAREAGHRV